MNNPQKVTEMYARLAELRKEHSLHVKDTTEAIIIASEIADMEIKIEALEQSMTHEEIYSSCCGQEIANKDTMQCPSCKEYETAQRTVFLTDKIKVTERLIKFRLWDTTSKLMRDDCFAKDVLFHRTRSTVGYFDDYPIMQFIGLHDMNGKEIFEGDILIGYRKGSNSDKMYTGVIEWQTEQAGWVMRCGKYIMEILSLAMDGNGTETRLSSFEIIANIHQPQ